MPNRNAEFHAAKRYTKKTEQAITFTSMGSLRLHAADARLLSAKLAPKAEISLTHSETPWGGGDSEDFTILISFCKMFFSRSPGRGATKM
jgi:hypothetical protein